MNAARNSPRRNVLVAFREACFAHPDGMEDLASKVGRTATSLYNKANVEDDTHPATLSDAVAVTQVTGNPIIAEAFAHLAGGVFVALPQAKPGDQHVLIALAKWSAENATWIQEFAEFKADGKLTDDELKQLRRRAEKVVSSLLELVHVAGGDRNG